MNLRKPMPRDRGCKEFAPEAYADFPIVSDQKIAELAEKARAELAKDEWELVDSIA